MKILKRIFVFALFAFAAVLAFGAIKVSATAGDSHTITFNDKAKRTVYNTSQQVWVENGITVTNDKGSSTSNVGDYANPARFYKSSTLTITFANKFDKIVFDCNNSSYATSLGKDSVTGGTLTVSSDKVTLTLDEGVTSVSFVLTDGQVRMDGLTLTECEVSNKPLLTTPVATLSNNKVLSWDSIDGVAGYKVGIFSAQDATSTDEIFDVDSNVTSFDLSNYIPQGTWYVKVKAVSGDNNYENSEWSNSAGTIDNGTKAYEITIEQALDLEIPTFENPVKYSITGKVSSIYQEYDSQWGNVSLNITDGERTIVAYRAIGDFASKVDAGAVVTVEGILTTYKDVNQLAQGCEIVQCTLADCAVGVQYADAGDGKQHARLVGKLNVNYQDVLSLSFTITDANDPSKTTTIVVTSVFGTLTANNESGVVEITAASLGVQSLFALTITNIPAGTTLNVTATFTTAGGTYTSAVKTVKVAAAE